MKYTYHRVCHTRSFKFDKFSSERREKKVINLQYAQFCEQRFLAVAKPVTWKAHKAAHRTNILDGSSVVYGVACVEAKCFGTSLFLLFSKGRNHITHEWLAAKKRGGEGRGGGEMCERKGISFPPSEPLPTNWFLLAFFSRVLLRVCAVKECSLKKKKEKYLLFNSHKYSK